MEEMAQDVCVCVCSLCYVCKCAHVFLCVVCVVYVCAWLIMTVEECLKQFFNLILYILKLAQAYYSYVVCVVLFVFHYPHLKETDIMTLIHE